MQWLDKKIEKSAKVYAEAFAEACDNARVKDPLHALVETDAYPRLQKIPEVEFAIGWLHCLAETIGIKVERLFRLLTEPQTAPARGRRGGK